MNRMMVQIRLLSVEDPLCDPLYIHGVILSHYTTKKVSLTEFFTVLLVFLPESGGIRAIPGIPRNGILAVLPAKIIISVQQNSGGFRNGHRNCRNGIASGIDRNGIRGIFLIIIVITVNY